MKLQDKGGCPQGILELTIIRRGVVVDKFKGKNQIVDLSKTAHARLLAGLTGYHVTKIGVGTDGTGPSPIDDHLTDPFVKNLMAYSFPEVNQVKYDFVITESEANGMLIQEFGLICADDTLYARKTRDAIEKESDIKIAGSWTIVF